MIRIFKYLQKREMFLIIATFVLTGLQVFLELKLPDYMSRITNVIVAPGSALQDVVSAGTYMLLCAFGGLAVSVLVGFCATRVATGFSMRLRGAVYHKVTDFSLEEINDFSTASLITRSTNDIVQWE